MLIRQECSRDYAAVYKAVARAFEHAEHRDGNEQDLVAALRTSDSFIPQLSLVAEQDGEIIGHVMFTKIQIGGCTELALAPLSVVPEHQRQGVGTALLAEGHKIAGELGFRYSVVLGSADYYPRAGYVSAERFGIRAPFEVPSENFMALKLSEHAQPLDGVVTYAKEFGIY